MLDKTKNRAVSLRAFIDSLPVLMGYTSMGFAAGVLLGALGGEVVPYSPVWGFASSLFVFSGTVSFALPEFLKNHESLGMIAVMLLAINFRYLFYGFSLLSRWREAKLLRKLFLIFCLTDETYALEIASPIKNSTRYLRYCTTLAALNLSYWVIGVTAGAAVVCGLGKVFSVETVDHWTKGIGFSMTALFLVILVDQVRGWFENA